MIETLEPVGRWLGRFQALDPGDRHIDPADMVAYIDRRLHRLVDGKVITDVTRGRVLRHLEALGGAIAGEDLREVVVHADFAPGNVMVDRGRVVVIDFAMMSRGARLLDLTRMHFQLELFLAKPWFRRATIEPLQRAVLRGFDPGLSPADPLFRFLMIRHRINHLGTVTLNRAGVPARLVNARLRRMHLQWLAEQVADGIGAAR
jgi:hypothetical protein